MGPARFAGFAVLVPLMVVTGLPTARAEGGPALVVFDADRRSPIVDATAASIRRSVEARGSVMLDASPPALPQPSAPALLERAVGAYHAFEYAEAVALLDQAAAELVTRGTRGMDNRALSDLFLYRALARTQLGDERGAWDDIVQAATLSPVRVLDEVQFAPRIADTFARAVAGLRARGLVDWIARLPADCIVTVDATDVGAGQPITLAPGDHYLTALCPGYAPYLARHGVVGAGGFDVPLTALTPVTPERAAERARERGAARVILARVVHGSPSTLSLTLVEASDGRVRSSAYLSVDEADRDARIARALASVMDEASGARERIVVAPATPRRPTPWYRRPWVWGLAGAAAAAIVLTPFVLDDGAPTGFDISSSRTP